MIWLISYESTLPTKVNFGSLFSSILSFDCKTLSVIALIPSHGPSQPSTRKLFNKKVDNFILLSLTEWENSCSNSDWLLLIQKINIHWLSYIIFDPNFGTNIQPKSEIQNYAHIRNILIFMGKDQRTEYQPTLCPNLDPTGWLERSKLTNSES